MTRSISKGVLNRALFACKMGVVQAVFPLRLRIFIGLEKGKSVFQKCLPEIPFKPDRVSFCTPNMI